MTGAGASPTVVQSTCFDSGRPGCRSAWHEVIKAADEADEPERFTAFTGRKIDRAYAESRARWEPLIEATQIKGDGETPPLLSPNDEFADYETWDEGNLDLSEAKKPEMLEFEHARSAHKNGLKLESELGINPYKFGMVGSSDAHAALAAVEEDNFFGKVPANERFQSRCRSSTSVSR